MTFIPTKPQCNWGQIQNAYVPAVTFCHLVFETAIDYNVGSYSQGFWTQNGVSSLPFLDQSWKGKYISPILNNQAGGIIQGK